MYSALCDRSIREFYGIDEVIHPNLVIVCFKYLRILWSWLSSAIVMTMM